MRETLHLCAFFPEHIERVLALYVTGMDIECISQLVGLSPREVNFILDHYTPYLEAL